MAISKMLIEFKCKHCGSNDYDLHRATDSLNRPRIKANCSICNRFISYVSETNARKICEFNNVEIKITKTF